MLDVRIFDGNGKLKQELSHEDVVALGNPEFQKQKRGSKYSSLYRRKKKIKVESNK